jgi:hypothetical protein
VGSPSEDPNCLPRVAGAYGATTLEAVVFKMRQLDSAYRQAVLSPSCAGMRWSVPELVTNLVTNSRRRKIGDGQLAEKSGGQGRD